MLTLKGTSVQNLLFGLLTGSMLAVATSGFALLRNTERFLHIAHGQFMALGAFLGLVLADRFGIVVGIALAIVATSLIGVACGKLLFDPVKHQGGNVMLFTSVGLAFVLYAVMIAGFGTELRVFDIQLGDSRDFGPISVAPGEVVLLLVAALVIVSLWLLLSRSAIGRDIRAVASNRELAQIRGVAIGRVSTTVWAVSSGLAAIGGIMTGVLGSVSTESGWTYILLVLAAAVLGGVGNILGVIAAALTLGIVMDVSALWIDTAYRPVVAFAILIVVLLVRPQGLFSFQSRQEATA
jgi:branched-subunit amino acid ABC-type transport system permease component